ncbi:MAG: hypothetical protein JKY65_30190 [Planctomycetes bacterium]|nr:hypothetical protein [Planctomycetota bacterium]
MRDNTRWGLLIPILGLVGCPQAPTPQVQIPSTSPTSQSTPAKSVAVVPLARDNETPIIIREEEVEEGGRLPHFDFSKYQPSNAVEIARVWLLRHQLEDGSWAADGSVGPGCEGECGSTVLGPEAAKRARSRDVATTALALLACAPVRRPSEQIRKALVWLQDRQQPDGSLDRDWLNHELATLALVNLCDFYNFEPATAKALAFSLGSIPPAEGETTGAAILVAAIRVRAFAEAKLMRFQISADRLAQASARLERLVGVRGKADPWALGALFDSQLRAGTSPPPSTSQTFERLLARVEQKSGEDVRSETWFYGSWVAVGVKGEAWSRWKRALEERLLVGQHTESCLKGAWDSRRGLGPSEGRVPATAWGALIADARDEHKRQN